jgi:hypothetical protein
VIHGFVPSVDICSHVEQYLSNVGFVLVLLPPPPLPLLLLPLLLPLLPLQGLLLPTPVNGQYIFTGDPTRRLRLQTATLNFSSNFLTELA